jgi:hypothetical protein
VGLDDEDQFMMRQPLANPGENFVDRWIRALEIQTFGEAERRPHGGATSTTQRASRGTISGRKSAWYEPRSNND